MGISICTAVCPILSLSDQLIWIKTVDRARIIRLPVHQGEVEEEEEDIEEMITNNNNNDIRSEIGR